MQNKHNEATGSYYVSQLVKVVTLNPSLIPVAANGILVQDITVWNENGRANLYKLIFELYDDKYGGFPHLDIIKIMTRIIETRIYVTDNRTHDILHLLCRYLSSTEDEFLALNSGVEYKLPSYNAFNDNKQALRTFLEYTDTFTTVREYILNHPTQDWKIRQAVLNLMYFYYFNLSRDKRIPEEYYPIILERIHDENVCVRKSAWAILSTITPEIEEKEPRFIFRVLDEIIVRVDTANRLELTMCLDVIGTLCRQFVHRLQHKLEFIFLFCSSRIQVLLRDHELRVFAQLLDCTFDPILKRKIANWIIARVPKMLDSKNTLVFRFTQSIIPWVDKVRHKEELETIREITYKLWENGSSPNAVVSLCAIVVSVVGIGTHKNIVHDLVSPNYLDCIKYLIQSDVTRPLVSFQSLVEIEAMYVSDLLIDALLYMPQMREYVPKIITLYSGSQLMRAPVFSVTCILSEHYFNETVLLRQKYFKKQFVGRISIPVLLVLCRVVEKHPDCVIAEGENLLIRGLTKYEFDELDMNTRRIFGNTLNQFARDDVQNELILNLMRVGSVNIHQIMHRDKIFVDTAIIIK